MSAALQLHVVPNDPNTPKPKKWRGEDPVFFNPDQIGLGTLIMYFGRLDHGTVWKVVEIRTHRWTKTRRLFGYAAEVVKRSDDDIVLLRLGSNETRTIRYSYLEGSARWRLAGRGAGNG